MKNELTIFGRKISLKMFNSEPQQNQQTEMKNFQKISEILGREVNSESTLTSEEMETLNTAFAENVVAPVQEEVPVQTEAADLSAQITAAVSAGVAPLQETISALEARLATVEGTPAAEATTATPVSGAAPTFENQPWLDPNNSLNKAAQEALKS
jgi:hypothetical protein